MQISLKNKSSVKAFWADVSNDPNVKQDLNFIKTKNVFTNKNKSIIMFELKKATIQKKT